MAAKTPGILTDVAKFCVGPSVSIREVIACIDANSRGIALVVDREAVLQGTITDGDIRRFMLSYGSLDRGVSELLNLKNDPDYTDPVTASPTASITDLLRIMRKRRVRQIPILDKLGRVVGLATQQDLIPDVVLPVQAVVMAGGRGTRLSPLTDNLPKPMLSVGGRPLLELVVERLQKAGIQTVNVTTHYKAESIKSHFGDGSDYGVKINYVSEKNPMGTAGGIGLLKSSNETLLVINGDILTNVDFGAMVDYHREQEADITLAVRKYDVEVPYGVVESDGTYVKRLTEKPSYSFFVNAGIYLLEPSAREHIGRNEPMDMPDLIQRLLTNNRLVASFPVREYWLDIGEVANYNQAQLDDEQGIVTTS